MLHVVTAKRMVKVIWNGSRRWNALGGITTVLDNGDLLIGGVFSIKRVRAGSGKTSAPAQ
ncbi:hypothetical protein JI752_015980 [Lysobacter sp. MMG2]|nr:hypothetical protein [Lysobacter sp. MMG2]